MGSEVLTTCAGCGLVYDMRHIKKKPIHGTDKSYHFRCDVCGHTNTRMEDEYE